MDIDDLWSDDEDFDTVNKVLPKHGCHDCQSMKMYSCTQGRKIYPFGGPQQCRPQKKSKGWKPRAQ